MVGVGVVYLTYHLFTHVLDDTQALVLTLLVGVSPQIVSFSFTTVQFFSAKW
jgi:predicted membrane-bound mannosyltransferase